MPGPQHLGYRPSLGDAASEGEWGIAIGEFTQRAKTMRMNLLAKRFHEAQREIAVTVNTEVSESERPKQPAPCSPLVVRTVPLSWAATVMTLVCRVLWIETAQAMRSE
jgi:hypothetical protein